VPDVAIVDGSLRLSLSVRERVLSLVDDEFCVPLAAITKAVAVPDVMAEVRGTRTGARIPGLLAIGTWSGFSGGRAYTDLVVVHGPGPGVVLTVSGQPWRRLVVGCEDPAQLLAGLGRPGGRRR
jgi:hypothetical protein